MNKLFLLWDISLYTFCCKVVFVVELELNNVMVRIVLVESMLVCFFVIYRTNSRTKSVFGTNLNFYIREF